MTESSPESRINKLLDTLDEMIKVSGQNEKTKIIPNCLVINSAPTDLPSNYITVENEDGFYIPAVKVAGLNVTNGDYVNILYITGTEAIAMQQGSGSTVGSGGARPLSDQVMFNGIAYTNIQDAINAAEIAKAVPGSGVQTVFVLGEVEHPTTTQITVPSGVAISGAGVGVSSYSTDEIVGTAIVFTNGARVNDMEFITRFDTPALVTGIEINGGTANFTNVRVLAYNSDGAGTADQIKITSVSLPHKFNNTRLGEDLFGNPRYGIYCTVNTQINVNGGMIETDTNAIKLDNASAVCYIEGVVIRGGDIAEKAQCIGDYMYADDGLPHHLPTETYNLVAPFLDIPGKVGLWYAGDVQRSTGYIYDTSGQGRTLTYTGNPIFKQLSNGIAYVDLDGTGDYFSRPTETDLDILGTEAHNVGGSPGLTMGGWVWFANSGGSEVPMSKGGAGGTRSYFITKTAGNNFLGTISVDGTVLTQVTSTVTFSTSTWFFFTMVFVPSTSLSVFVNGTKTTNTTSIPASIFNSSSPFQLGALSGANLQTGRYTVGYLSASALSDNYINGLFQKSRVFFGV